MLPLKRAFIMMAAVMGLQVFGVGAVTAAQMTGIADMETVFSFFAALFLGILLTIVVFARWFLKRLNPHNIDPMQLLFIKQLEEDTELGPILKRLEKADLERAALVKMVAELKGEQNSHMGSGEQHIRSLKP